MTISDWVQIAIVIGGIVAAVFGFFIIRLIGSLDKNTESNIEFGQKLIELSAKVDNALDVLSHHSVLTSAEIEALKDRAGKAEEEIKSLRESRHENGQEIQKIGFKYELLEREIQTLKTQRA